MGNCYVVVFIVVDEFVDYGIIVWWYCVVCVDMRFLVNVKVVRCMEVCDFVRVWQEGVWIFGIDMVFYCMVLNDNFVLCD